MANPNPKKNEIGNRYGRLLVVAQAPNIGNVTAWECRCDCGSTRIATGIKLRYGGHQSCGCARRKHGHTKYRQRSSQTYKSWQHMMQRCTNKKLPQWKDYGGRGISVCERWKLRPPRGQGFNNFLADMGERPANRTLDRIDNDAGYGPDNCRWATRSQQQSNQRRQKRRS